MEKKFPKSIQKVFAWLYHRWSLRVRLDKDIVKDLAEYFDLDQKKIIWMLKSGKRLNNDFWYLLNPKTEEEIKKFYEFTPYYIFDLTYWHMSRAQRNFRNNIIKLCEGDILDYGGGIGDLCLEFAKRGLNITYADIYGRTFEFAEWLFRKRGYEIETINLTKESLSKNYDTILCIDVIEHVSDPQKLLKDLTCHLNNNGKLIITNLNIQEIKYPMHFKIGFNAENYLNSLGLFRTKEPWLWLKS
ncbi:MAG: methyltransferase domain-containing protein [Minisyncoccales bacterium]